MSDDFIDRLPSHERRKWLDVKEHSPQEYEKIRKEYQVGMRGREAIAERMSHFAEFSLALETEKGLKESVSKSIAEQIRDKGIDKVVDGKIDKHQKSALEAGHFDVIADASQEATPKLRIKPKSGSDKGSTIDAPSGKISEALPLKPAIQDRLLLTFKIKTKK